MNANAAIEPAASFMPVPGIETALWLANIAMILSTVAFLLVAVRSPSWTRSERGRASMASATGVLMIGVTGLSRRLDLEIGDALVIASFTVLATVMTWRAVATWRDEHARPGKVPPLRDSR